MLVSFDQELQGKQKLYLEIFFRNCNPGDTVLGRNPSCVLRQERKGQSLLKRKKGGYQRDYINCFERVVANAGKQTYTILYMINCLYLLLGDTFSF